MPVMKTKRLFLVGSLWLLILLHLCCANDTRKYSLYHGEKPPKSKLVILTNHELGSKSKGIAVIESIDNSIYVNNMLVIGSNRLFNASVDIIEKPYQKIELLPGYHTLVVRYHLFYTSPTADFRYVEQRYYLSGFRKILEFLAEPGKKYRILASSDFILHQGLLGGKYCHIWIQEESTDNIVSEDFFSVNVFEDTPVLILPDELLSKLKKEPELLMNLEKQLKELEKQLKLEELRRKEGLCLICGEPIEFSRKYYNRILYCKKHEGIESVNRLLRSIIETVENTDDFIFKLYILNRLNKAAIAIQISDLSTAFEELSELDSLHFSYLSDEVVMAIKSLKEILQSEGMSVSGYEDVPREEQQRKPEQEGIFRCSAPRCSFTHKSQEFFFKCSLCGRMYCSNHGHGGMKCPNCQRGLLR